MYDDNGNLVWSRFEPMQKAIDRGDWVSTQYNDTVAVPHHLPETWDDMIKTFERIGNSMSCIRWIEGGVTMTPNEKHGIMLYEIIVQRPPNE
jgi:mannitol/fructose-specific phosphotransferase system IIA component